MEKLTLINLEIIKDALANYLIENKKYIFSVSDKRYCKDIQKTHKKILDMLKC